MKRFFFLLIVLWFALALLPQGAPAKNGGAESAMQAFIEAMVKRDSNAVLSFFPQQSTFKLIPYVIGTKTPETVNSISYNKLKSDFTVKKGLYYFFFSKPNGWEYQVEFQRGQMWRKKPGNMFTAPESSEGHTYIKWKQEGDKWVIDELAYVHP